MWFLMIAAMRRLLKNMSIYGIGGIIAKAIQFLLLPVYTRVLQPADYGSLELVYMVAGLIGILYGFMISSGYLRSYYDGKDDTYRDMVLGSAFWFTFFSSLFFAALSVVFAAEIADSVFKFDGGDTFIVLISVSTAIKAHSLVLYNLLMVRERARTYVTVNATTLLVTMGVTIYFVVFLGWAVKGILVALVIAYSVEFLILSVLLLRKTVFKYSHMAVKEMLKFSIPLIPLQIASFILTLSDRFFLQEFRDLEDVGLYSLGYKFAAILPLLTVEPFRAFGPHIFSLIDDPGKCKQTLADFSRYYLAGGLFFALVISMFSREVIMVMSDRSFYSSYKVVYLLCIAHVFFGLSSVTSYAINIVRKNWTISLAWLVAAGINILLNFLLIPQYGMIGASIATLVSYFAVMLGNLIVIKYVYPMRFRYFCFGSVFVWATLVYYVSTFLNYGITVSVMLKSGLLAAYLLIVFYSRYFTKEERDKARNLFISLFVKRPASGSPGIR